MARRAGSTKSNWERARRKITERQAPTSAAETELEVTTGEKEERNGRIGEFQAQIEAAARMRQREVGDGGDDGLEEKGKQRPHHHGDDRQKSRGVEQGNEIGQAESKGQQEGGDKQDEHIYLPIDGLVLQSNVVGQRRKSRIVFGIHGHEDEAGIGNHEGEPGAVDTDGLRACE